MSTVPPSGGGGPAVPPGGRAPTTRLPPQTGSGGRGGGGVVRPQGRQPSSGVLKASDIELSMKASPGDPVKVKSPFKGDTYASKKGAKVVDEGSSSVEGENELDEDGNKIKKDTPPPGPPKPKSKKPGGSAFKQQSWNACRPLLNPCMAILLYGGAAVFFLVAGSTQIGVTLTVNEESTRYDNVCSLNGWGNYHADKTNENSFSPCTVAIEVKNKMSKPVYVYYELEEFYQTHRRYLISWSEAQMRGETTTSATKLENCMASSLAKKSDTTDPRLVSLSTESGNDYLNPCGWMPTTVFNDTMYLSTAGTTATTIPFKTADSSWSHRDTLSPSSVSWDSESKRYSKNTDGGVWTNELAIFRNGVEDDRFQVWMRPAPSPNFRKLYGVVDQDLEVGTYYMTIHNRFPCSWKGCSKRIVLSTASAFGGLNLSLGWYSLVVSFGCAMLFVLAAAFAVVCPLVTNMDPEVILNKKLEKMARLKTIPKNRSSTVVDDEGEDEDGLPVGSDGTLGCQTCSKRGGVGEMKQCAGCKSVYYCSEACQRQDWPNHKSSCQPKTMAAGPAAAGQRDAGLRAAPAMSSGALAATGGGGPASSPSRVGRGGPSPQAPAPRAGRGAGAPSSAAAVPPAAGSGGRGATMPSTSAPAASTPGGRGAAAPPPGGRGGAAPPPGGRGGAAPLPGGREGAVPPPGAPPSRGRGAAAPPPGGRGGAAPPPGGRGGAAPPPGAPPPGGRGVPPPGAGPRQPPPAAGGGAPPLAMGVRR